MLKKVIISDLDEQIALPDGESVAIPLSGICSPTICINRNNSYDSSYGVEIDDEPLEDYVRIVINNRAAEREFHRNDDQNEMDYVFKQRSLNLPDSYVIATYNLENDSFTIKGTDIELPIDFYGENDFYCLMFGTSSDSPVKFEYAYDMAMKYPLHYSMFNTDLPIYFCCDEVKGQMADKDYIHLVEKFYSIRKKALASQFKKMIAIDQDAALFEDKYRKYRSNSKSIIRH